MKFKFYDCLSRITCNKRNCTGNSVQNANFLMNMIRFYNDLEFKSYKIK